MAQVPTSKRRVVYDLATAASDYPEWTGRPQRTILICTQQRSGSTLLGEALYFGGGMGCPLEYFHKGFRPGFESRWAPASFRDYVEALYRFRTDPTGTFSVKLFWADVMDLLRELDTAAFEKIGELPSSFIAPETYRRIFALLSEYLPNPTYVILKRRDSVRQAVSLLTAAHSGYWRWTPENKTRDESRLPEYDFNELLWRVALIQDVDRHWNNFFRANGINAWQICYEDLAANFSGQLQALFEHLGRPSAAVTPPRLRQQADLRSEDFVKRFGQEFLLRKPGARAAETAEHARAIHEKPSDHPTLHSEPLVPFTETTLVSRDPSIMAAEIDGEIAMINVKQSTFFGLDGISADIWRRLEAPRTFGELVDGLMADYNAGRAVISRDVGKLLSDLAERNVVKLR